MIEPRVGLEAAKLLKEKRFDWEVGKSYWKDGSLHLNISSNSEEHLTSAPSLSLTQYWLREVQEINIEVRYVDQSLSSSNWSALITKNFKNDLPSFHPHYSENKPVTTLYTENFELYEEALEAGILRALELL